MSFDGTDWLILIGIVGLILAIVAIYIAWRHYRLAQRASEPQATLIFPMPSESGRNPDTIPDPRNYPHSEFDSPAFGGPGFKSGWDNESLLPAQPPKREKDRTETALPKPPVVTPPKVGASSVNSDLRTSAPPEPKKRKPRAPTAPPDRSEWQDLMDKIVTVPAGYGQHWATRLELDAGDEIRGTITEVDDDEFSYMVMDEANYGSFRGGDDFEVIDEQEDTSSVRVDFSVDEEDRYYLVLYAYGKQNDREVEISLRVRTGRL